MRIRARAGTVIGGSGGVYWRIIFTNNYSVRSLQVFLAVVDGG